MSSHVDVLQHCAVGARTDGIEKFKGVFALFKMHRHRELRRHIKAFLRRENQNFPLTAVCFQHQAFFVLSVLHDMDGDVVNAVFFHFDIVKRHRAFAAIEPRHVFPVKAFLFHIAGKPGKFRFLAVVGAADSVFAYRHGVNERRVFRQRNIVAEVVFEILHSPLCKGVCVRPFVI